MRREFNSLPWHLYGVNSGLKILPCTELCSGVGRCVAPIAIGAFGTIGVWPNGKALALGARDSEFESRHPDHSTSFGLLGPTSLMVYDQLFKMEKTSLKIPNEVECPEPVEGHYFVYLLQCCDQSLYCGSTSDLKNRLKEHNAGEAAVWTKIRRPTRLVYFETHDSLLSARRREQQIKGWTINKKLNLINGVWKKI